MNKTSVHVESTVKCQFIETRSGKHYMVMYSHDHKNHTGTKPSDLLLITFGA